MEIKILKKNEFEQDIEFIVQLALVDFKLLVEKNKIKILKNFSVPGFRKGHVPIDLVNKQVSPESISFQTIYDSNSQIVQAIIKTKDFDDSQALDSAVDFQIEDLGLKTNQGPIVKVRFEKLPKVLNFDKQKFEKMLVVEELKKLIPQKLTIVKQIKSFLKPKAIIQDKKNQVVENGDLVNLDFEGFINGKPFVNGASKNYDLEIGSQTFVDGFEQQLIGLKQNDKKQLNVKFPQDYYVKDYAGKQAMFKVVINKIKTIIYPKIDQSLVENVWNLKNITNQDQLIKYFEQTFYENRFLQYVNEKILKEAKISHYPQSLIKIYHSQLLWQDEKKLKQKGFKDLDAYLVSIATNQNKKLDEIKTSYHQALLKEVKKHILIGTTYQYLLDQYQIEITQQDKDAFIQDKMLYLYDDENKAKEIIKNNELYYDAIIFQNKLIKLLTKKFIQIN